MTTPLQQPDSDRKMLADTLAEPRHTISFSSIPGLLENHARRSPDALAIHAAERTPLIYVQLYRHIGEVGGALRAMGIGRRDRVAVVLPNGPAAQAGIQPNDWVKAIDGAAVTNFSEVIGKLLDYEPGQHAVLTVERNGQSLDLPITLDSKAW